MVTQAKIKQCQSKSAIREVLGCLLQDPSLLSNHKIVKEDFVEAFHKVLFVAINNKYQAKATKLDSYIIEDYLKTTFPTKYGIFKRNNGTLYIDKAKEMATIGNFEDNFQELKKYSALRELLKNGIDVSEYFDPDEADPDKVESQRELFENSSVDDIINYYKGKIISISQMFSTRYGRDSVKAGSAEAKLQKELWKKKKDFGLSYSSNFLTAVTNGIRKKRFTVSSAGTGTGKTRISVANICHSFVPKYYDENKGEFVTNPHGTQNGALYIGTEMELIEEIEPILWAYIAKVPEEHITQNLYEPGEEARVDEAIRILDEEANIWLEYVPDYNIELLEAVIEEHVTKHHINHVFFDYIHTTTDLISEYQSQAKAKMQVREDQVLGNLSNKLKEMCRKYNISIDTWTQVTGDFKNENNRDQTIVRGRRKLCL